MRTLILIVASLSIASAWAADEPPKTREEVEQVFESLDRDGDDRISQREAREEESLRERFAGVDANGDSFLSRQEFRARPSNEPFE